MSGANIFTIFQLLCELYSGYESKSALQIHFYAAHHYKNGEFLETSPKSYQWNKNKIKQRLVCETCGDVLKTRWSMMKHNYEKHGTCDPEYDAVIE